MVGVLVAVIVVFLEAAWMRSTAPLRAILPISQVSLWAIVYQRQKRLGGHPGRWLDLVYAAWLAMIVVVGAMTVIDGFHHR